MASASPPAVATSARAYNSKSSGCSRGAVTIFTPLSGLERFDHVELRLDDRHDHQLCQAFQRFDGECHAAAVPGAMRGSRILTSIFMNYGRYCFCAAVQSREADGAMRYDWR